MPCFNYYCKIIQAVYGFIFFPLNHKDSIQTSLLSIQIDKYETDPLCTGGKYTTTYAVVNQLKV